MPHQPRPPPQRSLVRVAPPRGRAHVGVRNLGQAAALETDYLREVDEANATLAAAEALFIEIIVKNHHSDASSPSMLRTAVSCLLLEQICAVFSRYHRVLGVVADTIMRSIYIPNTAEFRELLGTVDYPLALPPSLTPQARKMLEPYARKTYFQAYEDVSEALARFTRSNRSIEIKLSRQTKVFDHTMRHWMTSVTRNFFLSWRGYTKRRLQLRAKYRAIFFRVRSDECKVKAIRRWRERASRIKKAAMVDAASADELQALSVSVTHMQAQIDTLSDYNANLSKQIADQEKIRQQLQQEIAAKEHLALEMRSRTQDIERLGSELIDTVLFKKLPPEGATPLDVLVNWAHGVIDASGGTIDGSVKPLNALLSDEYLVDIQISALGCVMMGFAGDRAPSREAVVQMHLEGENAAPICVAMYERLVGRPCVVTEEQLATGQRGVALLLLASLMRFATQWLTCPHPAPAGTNAVTPSPAQLAAGAATWNARIAIQHAWIHVALAAQTAALTVAVQHPQALSLEEQEDQRHFLDLPIQHLTDVLPLHGADRRHLEIMKALRKVYVDVRNLYMTYASPILTFADVLRLLKDCMLIGDRKITRKMVESVCKAAWRMDSASRSTEDGIGSIEVTKAHFTEVLVRLAYADLKRSSKDEIDLRGTHVASFISEKLVSHALRSDVDRFKQVVRHPQVQGIISKHKISLRRVFRKYANCDDGESMNRVAFQQMARDCEWITRTVSVDAVTDVFKRVQNVEQGSVEALDLAEWVECLCALAVYHNPNPFVPLPVKLASFVEDKVLNVLSV